jgi:DNA-binding MarR family transcriptional regulator
VPDDNGYSPGANESGAASVAADLNSGAIHLLRALGVVDRRTALTPARLSALSVLVFGGPHSLGGLAAAEDVAGPTMTRIVDGLVEAGLVAREADPTDGRAVTLSATVAGRELMDQARDRRLMAIVEAMTRLSVAERDALSTAAPALCRLAEALRAQL